MPEVQALFFLPVADNDGQKLTKEIREARDRVYSLCDGWTFLGGIVGAFKMSDGSRSIDKSHAYMVLIDEVDIPVLEEILRDFKSQAKQEAIYLEIRRNIDVRFI